MARKHRPADLLLAAPAGKRIFSAVDALMYPSFAIGAHGAIAAIVTAAPEPCVALWDAVRDGDHHMARRLHGPLLRLRNAIAGDNLPACVKTALELQGVKPGHPRAPMQPASPGQRRAIAAAIKKLA